MIIIRNKNNQTAFDKKLEAQKILDYEVADEASEENISVTKDLKDFKVYFPVDLEYNQYDISDIVRLAQVGTRPTVKEEYDEVTMSFNRPIKEATFFKVLKKIIENEGFVTIIDDNKG